MADLEARLKEARDCRFRLIATDGVFSMDGIIANLKGVCDLADKYDAMTVRVRFAPGRVLFPGFVKAAGAQQVFRLQRFARFAPGDRLAS